MITSFIFAGIFLAIVTILDLAAEIEYGTHRAIKPAMAAAGSILIFNLLFYQIFLFQTIHWLDYGPIIFFDLLIILFWFGIPAVATSETREPYGAMGFFATLVLIALFFLVFVGGNAFVVPPHCCGDEGGTNRLANLISVQANTGDHHDIDIENMIRVTPDMALAKANKAMPSGSDGIGSYLETNKAQLQLVAGHYWYIVDLKVSNWIGFENRGSYIPGYFRVDAQDPDADAEFMGGYEMKYVPGIRGFHGGIKNLFGLGSVFSGNDLKMYVHRHVLVPNGWRADDLESLEIDENWNPFYTAALLKPAVGNTGYVVDAYLIVDPQTGEYGTPYRITRTTNADGMFTYDTSNVPAWVNRIFSLDLISKYVEWWGKYKYHEEKFIASGKNGLFKVDTSEDVVTENGLAFQFTLTSVGRDTALSYVIYVDPRTGEAHFYETKGDLASPTLDNIKKVMLEKVGSMGGNVKYTIDEAEFQWMLGKLVVYAIVTTTDTQSYSGVALVETNNADNKDKVIYAPTLNEAYLLLARQIASEGGNNQALLPSSSQVQVHGVIDRIAGYTDAGRTRYQFTLISADVANTIQFVMDANQRNALMRSGDEVILIAMTTIDPTAVNEVFSLTNLTLPLAEPAVAPTATPAQ